MPFSAEAVTPDAAVGAEVVDAYVAMVAGRLAPGPREAVLAYTAMHGVGRAVTERAFAAAGFAPLLEVAAQCEPDGTFPTVVFPNPEEPGALDLLVDRAAAADADAGLAHDPDADRLGVVVPRDGGWEKLTGDQIGVLLADHLLGQGSGPDRLVVRTIVSSRLLDAVAAAHGATAAATLTGFKHVMGAARARPDLRLVLGYEEALGLRGGRRGPRQGRHRCRAGDGRPRRPPEGRRAAPSTTVSTSWPCATGCTCRPAAATASRASTATSAGRRRWPRCGPTRPSEVAGRPRRAVVDHLAAAPPAPVADVVVLELGAGCWMAVRPSGTEPKLKVYAEVVEAVVGADVAAARARAEAALDGLHTALAARLGFPSGDPLLG